MLIERKLRIVKALAILILAAATSGLIAANIFVNRKQAKKAFENSEVVKVYSLYYSGNVTTCSEKSMRIKTSRHQIVEIEYKYLSKPANVIDCEGILYKKAAAKGTPYIGIIKSIEKDVLVVEITEKGERIKEGESLRFTMKNVKHIELTGKKMLPKALRDFDPAKAVDNGDGTISYGALSWQKCSFGQRNKKKCKGKPKKATYKKAKKYCEKLKLGKLKGWRLPTGDELQQIVKCSSGRHRYNGPFDANGQPGGIEAVGCKEGSADPAVDNASFPGVPKAAMYWTGGEQDYDGQQVAAFFHFGLGHVVGLRTLKSKLSFRCVRDIKTD